MSIEKLKKAKYKALLNNCVDDDEAILYQRELNTDTMICGLCKFYDSDMCFCEKHLKYGELVERDTCSDYRECE